MAPSEINHNLVKQQIVDILQNNANLFDINVIDGSRLTYLEVGEPNQVLEVGGGKPIPPTFPALWVTNSRTLETIQRKGITTNNQHSFLTHNVSYALKLMVNEQDSIVSEKVLDDLQEVIMETLEADVALSTGSQTLPKSPDDGWPERVETFREENDGGPVRGKVITWHYLFTTN